MSSGKPAARLVANEAAVDAMGTLCNELEYAVSQADVDADGSTVSIDFYDRVKSLVDDMNGVLDKIETVNTPRKAKKPKT